MMMSSFALRVCLNPLDSSQFCEFSYEKSRLSSIFDGRWLCWTFLSKLCIFIRGGSPQYLIWQTVLLDFVPPSTLPPAYQSTPTTATPPPQATCSQYCNTPLHCGENTDNTENVMQILSSGRFYSSTEICQLAHFFLFHSLRKFTQLKNFLLRASASAKFQLYLH